MAIYDNLPYTNFHELNRRWLLQQMKEAKAKVDSIQAEIDQFNEDYAALAAVFNVSGNNVSIPGTMTANGFIGNLTGNASTATYATSAGSATTATNAGHATTADSATNATNAGHATTADSATNATNATTADSATTASTADYATTAGSVTGSEASEITVSTETDANNLVPATALRTQFFQIANTASNLPTSNMYPYLIMSSYCYDEGTNTSFILQVCWPCASNALYYRIRFSGAWQSWKHIALVS